VSQSRWHYLFCMKFLLHDVLPILDNKGIESPLSGKLAEEFPPILYAQPIPFRLGPLVSGHWRNFLSVGRGGGIRTFKRFSKRKGFLSCFVAFSFFLFVLIGDRLHSERLFLFFILSFRYLAVGCSAVVLSNSTERHPTTTQVGPDRDLAHWAFCSQEESRGA